MSSGDVRGPLISRLLQLGPAYDRDTGPPPRVVPTCQPSNDIYAGYVWRPPASDPGLDVLFPVPGAFTDAPPAASYTLKWNEVASAGVVERTVAEESAPMASGRSCTGVTWAPSRSLTADGGVVAVTDLASGFCYRYTITVTDAGGATASAASGPLLITNAPPPCAYGDPWTSHRAYGDWQRTLLGTTYRLPSTYAPVDLVYTSGIYHMSGSFKIRSLAKADLYALANAARAAGATLDIASAYRSYSTQKSVFNYFVSKNGLSSALLGSARAGHSEHQLGTTIDFKSYGGALSWYTDWATTKAGAWLKQYGWKYGWIMSYPKASSPSKTCYQYEPWHYRYYGRALAKAIRGSGLSPREYLWQAGSLFPGA